MRLALPLAICLLGLPAVAQHSLSSRGTTAPVGPAAATLVNSSVDGSSADSNPANSNPANSNPADKNRAESRTRITHSNVLERSTPLLGSAALEGGGSSPVPEPSTLLLVGTGLVGIALTARRRRKRATDV